MNHVVKILLTLATFFSSPTWQSSFTVKLLPNEKNIAYFNDAPPQLRFTFDPNCTNENSMKIYQKPLFATKPTSDVEWSLARKNLGYDSVKKQFFIEWANYTQSGSYSAECKNKPYQPEQDVLIRVKPQILLVDAVEDSSQPAEFKNHNQVYNFTVKLEADLLKLRFHVGNGYYDNGETGKFNYHSDFLANLTDGNETSFDFDENFPGGTVYQFDLSIDKITTTNPMTCQFTIEAVTFMVSDREGTSDNVVVNLNVEYRPYRVQPFVTVNNDGTCQVGCSTVSSCPTFYEAKLEIYDASLDGTAIFAWNSSVDSHHLTPIMCSYLRRLRDSAAGPNSFFRCSLTNSAGAETVSKQLDLVEGIDQLVTMKPTTPKTTQKTTQTSITLTWTHEPETTTELGNSTSEPLISTLTDSTVSPSTSGVPTDPANDSQTIGTVEIVLIVLATVFFVLLVGVLAAFIVKIRFKSKADEENKPSENNNGSNGHIPCVIDEMETGEMPNGTAQHENLPPSNMLLESIYCNVSDLPLQTVSLPDNANRQSIDQFYLHPIELVPSGPRPSSVRPPTGKEKRSKAKRRADPLFVSQKLDPSGLGDLYLQPLPSDPGKVGKKPGVDDVHQDAFLHKSASEGKVSDNF